MSADTDLDNSINVRRSVRRAVAQSLLGQDEEEATPLRKREQTVNYDGSGYSSTGSQGIRLKRVKLEQYDEEDEDLDNKEREEDNVSALPKARGASRSLRNTKERRYSDSLHPIQSVKHRMRLRHNSSDFSRKKRHSKQNRVENPLRRSTREKRFVFATFKSSDMIKQIEGQHDFPEFESEDEMDPYEKLLSPHRMPRRSARQHHDGPSGVGGEGGEASRGQGSRDEGNNEGNKDEDDDSDQESVKEEEEEEEESDNSEEQSEGEGEEVGYYLRKRRPVIYQYQPVLQVVEDDTPPKTRRKRRGREKQSPFHGKPRTGTTHAYGPRKGHQPRATASRQAQHHGSSSTSSSGSDSDEAKFRRRKKRSMAKARSLCLPMNFDPEEVAEGGVIRDRTRIGASLADVDPMNVERSVTFDSVGGHKHHIRALKEMIIFPLLYPEVFERFKISPPRGVLFFGPPGCGKTLMARALANECSKGGKKVAFFMRKGADCLSKWVGESERQLRLLFDQAYQMRPSIIFFDEIDGLAPVRSSRQDQIHSSIVSTLLALMDGLDNRGEIVVIGATNRIDAIDPALRRPGRFDREFVFPLPSREDRLSILSIHTRLWQPPLKPTFIAELADSTVGYCGADLKSLCTEAALFALRRKYPQIYTATEKLVLDVTSINVQASDFYKGIKAIVPTAQRSDVSVARTIPETVRPLLLESFSLLLSQVGFIFPPAWKCVCKASKEANKRLAIEKRMIENLKNDLEKLAGEESGSRYPILKSVNSSNHSRSDPQVSAIRTHISEKVGANPSSAVRHGKTLKKNTSTVHSQTQSEVGTKRGRSGNHTLYPSSVDYWSGVDRSDVSESTIEKAAFESSFNQLYQSRKTESLDEVYFDLHEAFEDNMDATFSKSILVMNEREQNSSQTDLQQDENSGRKQNQLPSQNLTLSLDDSPPVLLSEQYLSLSSHPHATPSVYRPRLILCGRGGMGQSSHLAPALLHAMEDLQVQTIDLPALFAVSSKTPEEACTQIFREAKRLAPSVVYLPRIATWWDIVPGTFHATFMSILLSLPTDTPLFVLATAECPWTDLPGPLRMLFGQVNSETYTVQASSLDQRRRFFYKVLVEKPLQAPPSAPRTPSAVQLEELPVASPPKPRELTNEEFAKIEKQREAVLRELRIFLRDTTNKLLAERKFKEFVKPVNQEEVPDYHDIILEPMDLSTIMRRIDEHHYTTPKQWIADVNLVTKNALEYNPEHDSESRLLRHRAVALQDMANSILDHELSEDFEKQCEEIAETYSRLGRDPHDSSPLKKTASGNSLSTHVRQRSNTASQFSTRTTQLSCDGALKTELYNAPRRSLRQKGVHAEGSGFPYYSPSKLRQFQDGGRNSTTSPVGEREKNEEEEEMDAAGYNQEVITIDGAAETGQRSNTITRRDAGCEFQDEYVSKRVGGSLSQSEPSKNVRANSLNRVDDRRTSLRNSNVRRQIIRPWEDKMEKSLSPLDLVPSLSEKPPLQNGTSSLSSEIPITNPNANQTPSEQSIPKPTRRRSSLISVSNSIPTSVEVDTGTRSQDISEDMIVSPSADNRLELNSTTGVDLQTGKSNSKRLQSKDVVPVSCGDVRIDRGKLLSLFEKVTVATEDSSCEEMERLYATFQHLVFRYRMTTDRLKLVEDLELAARLSLGPSLTE